MLYLCPSDNVDSGLRRMKQGFSHTLLFIAVLWLMASCSSTKYVPEGAYLLDEVKIHTDEKSIKPSSLYPYLRQSPNTKWFSLIKTQLYIYNLSGRDSTKWTNKFLRRIGNAPVIYNESNALRSEEELTKAVRNLGYMEASVKRSIQIKKKKLKLTYDVKVGKPYTIHSLKHDIYGDAVAEIVRNASANSLLKEGMLFDVNILDAERQRITNELLKSGYYRFNKEYIDYTADTVLDNRKVDLTLHLRGYRASANDSLSEHKPYRITQVNFVTDYDVLQPLSQSIQVNDSMRYKGYSIYFKDKPYLRPKVLLNSLRFAVGDFYNEQHVQQSHASFGRLSALKYSNIRFVETMKGDSAQLNSYVMLTKGKLNSVSFEVEGTNSAGDLGAAASVSYQNRNLFRGSELFTIKLRGAYEAITGLQAGYADNNYTEYGVESRINFPSFLFPFLSSEFRRRVRASTEFGVQYNHQVRPEFTRTTASASWSYRWSNRQKVQHKVDLLNVAFMYLPYISEKFSDDYINQGYEYIFRYNYQDRLIINMGYNYYFNSVGGSVVNNTIAANSYSIRFNIESAGNLMYALSKTLRIRKNGNGDYAILGIPYAQYLKSEFDFASNTRIDGRNSLALHIGVGIGVPYGNARFMPLEKQYFSGGANSVRGWSVRSLGPGSFAGNGNLLDQMGNIKLDASVEYRSKLFWKLQGAVFVDAGNIWTIRDYENQPGGVFKFNTFYKQIAMAYGLGLRLDLDFFILRFDGGMKAINPIYESGSDRYPILSPKFSRDFAFHFAVGYPF